MYNCNKISISRWRLPRLLSTRTRRSSLYTVHISYRIGYMTCNMLTVPGTGIHGAHATCRNSLATQGTRTLVVRHLTDEWEDPPPPPPPRRSVPDGR